MKKSHLLGAVCALSLGFSISSHAAAVTWEIVDGGNGHMYEYIAGNFTWDEANADLAPGWTLATITSAEEQTFINGSSFFTGDYIVWIGGRQDPGQLTPSAGWNWVTGEAWSYENWYSTDPNDGDGTEGDGFENYLIMGNLGSGFQSDQWLDAANNTPLITTSGTYAQGYLAEKTVVPVPAAVWLFGSGLLGLVGMARRKKA